MVATVTIGKKTKKKAAKFTEYEVWAKELDKSQRQSSQFANDILESIKDHSYKPKLKNYSQKQLRAAALLVTTISTSEEYRVDAARKLGRAALRTISAEGKTFLEAFGETGIYPMSSSGGTAYTRSLVTKGEEGRKPTKDEIILARCLSPLRDPNG